MPQDDAEEQVDFVDAETDDQGLVTVGLRNPALLNGVSLLVQFRKTQLPQLTLWRCWQSGLYTMGIEPCTDLSPSALSYQGEGTPHFLEPGETKSYDLILSVTEDAGR